MRDTISEFAMSMDDFVESNYFNYEWETASQRLHLEHILDDVAKLNTAFMNYHFDAEESDGFEIMFRAIELATDIMMLWSQIKIGTRHNRAGYPIKSMPKMSNIVDGAIGVNINEIP